MTEEDIREINNWVERLREKRKILVFRGSGITVSDEDKVQIEALAEKYNFQLIIESDEFIFIPNEWNWEEWLLESDNERRKA